MIYFNRFLISVLVAVVLLGCGNGFDPSSGYESTHGKGAFVFQLSWPADVPQIDAVNPAKAMVDCDSALIETVWFNFYDENNVYLTGDDWPCSAHRGRVDGIPAGAGRTLIVTAEDTSGQILYYAKEQGITIAEGEITQGGEIPVETFIPTLGQPVLLSLQDQAVTNGENIVFSWSPVSDAATYEWALSSTENFSAIQGSATIAQQTYTYSRNLADGTYYWRVRALDQNWNFSDWSQTSTFSVSRSGAAGTIPDSVTWQTTDMGAVFSTQGKIIVGDARNDGRRRVYTGDTSSGNATTGNIYEFSYSTGQWSAGTPFGSFEAPNSGTRNLSFIYGMTIASRSNDGLNALYACGSSAAEFRYDNTSNFVGQQMGTSFINDVVVGAARNDSQNRVYYADWEQIFEMTYTGGGWTQEVINTEGVNIGKLAIADGRNDGVLRLYGTRSMRNDLYEFTRTGGQWQAAYIGALQNITSVDGICAGIGRNDGRNRLYIVGYGGVAEMTYDGSNWQETAVGMATSAEAIMLGAGRDDGRQYLYIAEDRSTLREYHYSNGWRPTSVLLSGQQINGVAVGDGRNSGAACVYATAEDNHVYEFCAP